MCITLNDEDVLFIDDSTGNIVVPADKIPSDVSVGDELEIHYTKDPETITHAYIFRDLDSDNSVVTLDWVKQLGEAVLREGRVKDFLRSTIRPNAKDRLNKGSKKADKAQKKLVAAVTKHIQQEMGPKGKTWAFYLDPDNKGKYQEGPLTQKQAKAKYESSMSDGKLSDLIANAMVVDNAGFIIRRGLELFGFNNSSAPKLTKKTTLPNQYKLTESLLVEAPVVKLDSADLMNPDQVDFKSKIRQGLEQERVAAEREARSKVEAELKSKYSNVIDDINKNLRQGNTVSETLDMLFDKLVPSSGPADSVAGEFIRAIVRIMYRDMNDGDKFFEGYGLETCGSSAQYLFDHGFEEDIQNIMDNSYQLADDDHKYTDALTLVGEHVITRIAENPSLLYTKNEEDSREYDYDYIAENQPRYEFEVYGSDVIVTLVEKGILTSWDLKSYVEDILSYEPVYEGASVARPWGHHDTSVTVENLTKDGYERLEDSFNHNIDMWWEDLVSEHAAELDDSEYDDEY